MQDGNVITVSGSLTLMDSSSGKTGKITGGNNKERGGGVIITDNGTLTMNGGTISGNATGSEGAGVCVDKGTFVMNDGSISGNEAETGGGVGVNDDTIANFYMNGGTISDNQASVDGGGVYLDDGKFIIKGGNITGNKANGNNGGGVFISGNSTFSIQGGKITYNFAYDNGGGVFSVCGFTMTSGSIADNTADGCGGGVYTKRDFTMTGGSITGNKADGSDANNGDGGGGVYVDGSGFSLEGGSITDNSAIQGGGVYICCNSINTPGNLIMKGGNISKNKACAGGGVYVDCGFTMKSGSISENTAYEEGGGVFITVGSEFTMIGGTINSNTAVSYGGGVYNEGTFKISGNPKITGNTVASAYNNVYDNQITIAGPLTSGASVGVTMDTPGTFTIGYKIYHAGTAPSNYFSSDVTSYAVTKDSNGEAQLVDAYTVTFDANGHGTAPADQHLAPGDKVTKPTDPTADGYVFGGWYMEASCSTEWDFDNYTVTADTTLYAKWTERAVVTKTPAAKDLTYIGSAQELVTKGDASGGTMKYALGTDSTTVPTSWGDSIPTGTNAGTYYVWYKAAGDDTHTDSTPACITIVISVTPESQTEQPQVQQSQTSEEQITINKKPTLKKPKPKKNKATITWNKLKRKTKAQKKIWKQIKQIEVEWSTDPNFPKELTGKKTLGKRKTKTNITGLQRKTLYFVRVRYSDGIGGYSRWSKVKRFRTK